MKFFTAVFLAALVLAVVSINIEVEAFPVPESINSPLLKSLRIKRTIGITKDTKKEWEIKTKDGGSLRVTKTTSYNDGGALTLLPTVMDSATNNRIRILNQLQNGHGRPELANSSISGAISGSDTSFGGDFKTDIGVESQQANGNASANTDDSTTSTTANSINVDGGFKVEAVSVNTGYSYIHSKMKRLLEKSIEYHRQKLIQKQNLLNRLAARYQKTIVLAVTPTRQVLTPDCGHQTSAVYASGYCRQTKC